ncbi:MauE/DoxX family redox-associated membrane protein [Mesonia aestuariivivens]|uniref:Methylamine utilisation protein MauE domain-containing protein n=1 Tax=Mesonia aestuariivivens TaxID=2796128 RepID=A0ABS6W4X1_9FLAO|nr:MauE/DoxX family redox-associated membrane protein [Mesonia aestuariivivens]MBW2962918.1 hypothetical protein [Mesonia aestuariivivens]
MKPQTRLLNFIRYGFLMLFFYAGLTKLLTEDAFYNNLYNSPLLPKNSDLISVFAWSLPFLEISIALSLLVQHYIKASLIAVVSLLSFYAVYVAALLWWAPYQPCSCGGVSSLLSWKQHLLLNGVGIAFAFMGLYVIRARKKKIESRE